MMKQIKKIIEKENPTPDEIEFAYSYLHEKYEKYHGKSLRRRIGFSYVFQSGTAFFERHYGIYWRKIKDIKKNLDIPNKV